MTARCKAMIRFDVLAEGDERVDRALHRGLAAMGIALPRRRVRAFVEAGLVRVDGKVLRRSSSALRPGTIHFELDRHRRELDLEAAGRLERSELGRERLLHVDATSVAIDKPADLPTDPTRDPHRDSALAATGRLLALLGESPEGLRAVHRLDLDTTGVLLFGRGAEATAALAASFRDRTVEKRYLALAAAAPGWVSGDTVRIDQPLAPVQRGTGVAVSQSGKAAVTVVRVLSISATAMLVECRPETGRTHQIRAHLATVGAPILGDSRYGGPTRIAGQRVARVMLHSARLEIGGLDLRAPVPDDLLDLADILAANPQHSGAIVDL